MGSILGSPYFGKLPYRVIRTGTQYMGNWASREEEIVQSLDQDLHLEVEVKGLPKGPRTQIIGF